MFFFFLLRPGLCRDLRLPQAAPGRRRQWPATTLHCRFLPSTTPHSHNSGVVRILHTKCAPACDGGNMQSAGGALRVPLSDCTTRHLGSGPALRSGVQQQGLSVPGPQNLKVSTTASAFLRAFCAAVPCCPESVRPSTTQALPP